MAQGICPIGYFYVEGCLYFGFVEHGVGRALDGGRVLVATTGTYVALARTAQKASRMLNHLSEVVPGAYAQVGVMIYARLLV